jgi:hypothetical protein
VESELIERPAFVAVAQHFRRRAETRAGIGTIADACVIAALTLAFPSGDRPISQFY